MNKTLCVIATLLPFFVGDLNSQEILHFEPIVDLQQSADGISFPPVFVAFPPGESDRGFVVSLNGEVRVVDIKTREISSEPFLIVDDLWDGFGGLYSVAFHPDYRFNGRLFVCYAAANGDFVIQEYVRQSPDDAIAGEKVFVIEHDSVLDYGGWMGFGIDGFLYVSVGGGLRSSNRPTLGGTVMRINVDADDFPDRDDLNYSIPAENPLASTPGYEEVIATGLKNAWRCSFDSQGNLFIGALGTIYREEIELIPANHPEALNFGFPCFEGLLEQQDPAVCDFAGLPFTLPIFEYEHSEELSGIIGGYVIEQEIIPELTGSYIYADLRDQFHVYSLRFDGTKAPQDFNGNNVVDHRVWRTSVPHFNFDFDTTEWFSFSRNSVGDLFVISGSGGIYRLDSIRRVGDFNGDDKVTLLDVEPFVDALTQTTYQGLADINYDLSVDATDILPFIELIQN